MDEKKHYLVCEDKCMVEGYSKEEVDELLTDVDTKVSAKPSIYKGTSFSAPSDWKDGDLFVVYEE